MKGKHIVLALASVALLAAGCNKVVQNSQTNTRPESQPKSTSEKTLDDGTIVKPDGTKVKPDGTMVKPDGTMVKPDGTMVKPDGTMVKPDGTMVKPDGTMIKPDGTVVKPSATVKPSVAGTGDVMVKESASSYVNYSPQVLAEAEKAQKDGRKVVLYFHAPWCPFCQAADKDFKANLGSDKFPKNLTIIKTDYDSQTELKKKYAVTIQHTFVQIDSSGNQITKWISGDTAQLAANIK